MALPDFFKGVVDRGLTAVDLLNEEQWTVAKNEFGLTCSMAYVGAGGINEGLNNPKHHETLINAMKTGLPKLKAAGFPNAICFFGKRDGMSDYDGIKNSIACLKQIKPIAEDNGVTVNIELLNSKVNHPDYIGDNTPYGAAIVAAIDSPNIKLLYDIYHMQIMEGDVIATIDKYKDQIGHYHTGGVPGPQRARRDAGAELAGGHRGDHRHRLQGPLRARVHPEARPDDVASAKRSRCVTSSARAVARPRRPRGLACAFDVSPQLTLLIDAGRPGGRPAVARRADLGRRRARRDAGARRRPRRGSPSIQFVGRRPRRPGPTAATGSRLPTRRTASGSRSAR